MSDENLIPLPPKPRAVLLPAVDTFAAGVYDGASFFARFLAKVLRPPHHWGELTRQAYEIGYRSMPLITLTGFITGVVFTKQSRPSLASFGATSWLPSMITIALVGSLAPLITALICAGKVGSSIGAELASMKVTEQIEAMEVSGIDPFKFLVVTRTLTTMLVVPALTLYCCLMGLVGCYIDVHLNEATSLEAFLKNGFGSIAYLDVWSSMFKAFAYGLTIGVVSCYKGFNATKGTEGVGRAANASVVLSMFLIFIEEVLIVQVITWLRVF